MRIALYALMTLYTPERPARERPPSTGGSGGRIFYTATRAQAETSEEEAEMSINASAGLVTKLRAEIPGGTGFFGDGNLRKRLGSMSKTAWVVYVGNPISETVEGGSRAILVNTGSAYGDGSVRPTIVYVRADAIDPVSVPPEPPASEDVAEAIEIRDSEWREWLLDGSPGSNS